jgi:general L-amino acid transport system substrate-binding protein
MRKSLLVLFSALLVFSVALAGCSSSTSSETAEKKKSTLEVVKERGKLISGVNAQLPGFGYVGSDGEYVGFDVDFSKAIAAAVFGDASKVEFRPLSAQERFTAVQTGEVDVLVRNTTWTTTRDTSVGLTFGPTTFYDGQGIMVRKDSGIKSLKDLAGRIAVETGTTTELNLTDAIRRLGIDVEVVTFDNADTLVAAYEEGSVDAWTTDKSGLLSRLTTLANPADHVVLKDTLSKEPLGPSVKAGDDQWLDIVRWVTFATIQAEEYGITQDNIDEFLNSDNPEIRRFLGLEGELGQGLGLDKDFVVNVIKAVGNYGEIFDRHLGPDTVFNLERGQNDLYTNGGLMYSPPFR